MTYFAQKIMYFILSLQEKFLKFKLNKHFKTTFVNSTTKVSINNGNTLILNTQTQKNKERLTFAINNVLKTFGNNPEKLLEFISKHGTQVVMTKYANLILRIIGEQEGLIMPKNGFSALFVNFISKQPLRLKSDEKFIMRDMSVNKFYMLYQFYKWYALRLNLPGFDTKTQSKFLKFSQNITDEELSTLSMDDIISLKESIQRDIEAIDFVVNFAKSTDGSQNALKKLIAGGASI